MEKTKEIHKALKRRKFVNAEINSIKEAIDRLTKIVNTFENERKVLDFELHSWDIFYNKAKEINLNKEALSFVEFVCSSKNQIGYHEEMKKWYIYGKGLWVDTEQLFWYFKRNVE